MIFEKLVPAGRGRLIIQRKADRNHENVDEDSEDERRESVENYTGVGISVSFNSKHDEQQRIQQLSGGQKSTSSLSALRSYSLRDINKVSHRSLRTRARVLHPAMRPGSFLPV
jgi:hypothetical protein